MSEHRHDKPTPPNRGHEIRDIDVRRIVLYAAVLVAVIAASLAAMKATFDFFARREAANQPQPSTLAVHAPVQLPPEPRLQANPLNDLAGLRAEEDRLLTTFGWVDRPHGIVRIPVEQAMRLAVTRGLPHREAAEVGAAGPGAGPAAAAAKPETRGRRP